MPPYSETSLDYLLSIQRNKWVYQHDTRASEHREIEDRPNAFAVRCAQLITPRSTIVEFGAANGRDSRYWARELGCSVLALDIAPNACEMAMAAARLDDTVSLVTPAVINGLGSNLPLGGESNIDGFYARSALHLPDQEINKLFNRITTMLRPGGLIMVEGKDCTDPDIAQSKIVDGEPYLHFKYDNFGYPHLRRAWDYNYVNWLVENQGLELVEIQTNIDDSMGKKSIFTNFIARKK